MSKVYRNLSTPEGRAFWTPSARAHEVETWPDWKRAGINVAEIPGLPEGERPKKDRPR